MKKAELEEQLEQQRAVIIKQRQQIDALSNRWQAEQEHWQHVCDEHNAILHMLDDLFSFKVGATEFDGDTPLWDITDRTTGERLVSQQRDSAEAYRLAISKRVSYPPIE